MLAPSPSDMELVKRLREESPEQFISLVKMHLSFCLDQCTDEWEPFITIFSYHSRSMLGGMGLSLWCSISIPAGKGQDRNITTGFSLSLASRFRVDCPTALRQVAKTPQEKPRRFDLSSAASKKAKAAAASTTEGVRHSRQIYQLVDFLSRPSSACFTFYLPFFIASNHLWI